MSEKMQLPIDSIKVKDGRRAVDESKVRELAQSMSEVGQIARDRLAGFTNRYM